MPAWASSWPYRLGLLSSCLLLLFAAVIVVGLVLSSAYFQGIYGALGRGIAMVALAIAALVVEVFALLPIFQLRFLRRAGGR
jgi:hypothetical protein